VNGSGLSNTNLILKLNTGTDYPFVLCYQNLNSQLKSSMATWKVVVGHHTIRSLGRHGETPELVKHVLPILEVSFLLSHCILKTCAISESLKP